MTSTDSSAATLPSDWESLRLLNSYRLFVAVVLMTGFLAAPDSLVFGRAAPLAFLTTAFVYGFLGLVFALGLHRRHPGYMTQCYLHFYTDVVVLGIVIHASGGVASGLGILMVVPVAAAGTLLPIRYSLLYAALATVLLLASETIRQLATGPEAAAYTPAALLGMAMFATALLAGVLARRHAESAALARRRSRELQQLERLNERIIQQMEAGILVVAPDDRITLANASARILLDRKDGVTGHSLAQLSQRLDEAMLHHRATGQSPLGALVLDPGEEGARRVQVQFTDLGEQGTMLMLEDAAFIENQLQQMKLASLGRLTAGIAHEVRNPLAAITHSAQLLAESDIDRAGQRMVEIQLEHCRRINAIVEGILQVSRHGRGSRERIELPAWLRQFTTEFQTRRELPERRMRCEPDRDTPPGLFHPEQLRQILINLCDNCLQHGETADGHPVAIRLRLARDADGRPLIDVIDNGVPVSRETLDDIFEPFYTTSRTGTGLGLYLARELCELNEANLQYIGGFPGNCLRISLQPDPGE